MGIELRITDDPKMFDVFDMHGKVGDVWYWEPDQDDDQEGWVATIDRAKPIVTRWESDPLPTIAEAIREAWTMYGWLLEERLEMNRFYRNRGWHVISTPMGGQPRR